MVPGFENLFLVLKNNEKKEIRENTNDFCIL